MSSGAAASSGLRQRANAELQDFTTLFIDLSRQALADPRLAAPLPCLPHWLAGSDHIVVAVSSSGARAGLMRGDVLEEIGGTTLNGRADGVWDAAMRRLRPSSSYAVVARRGAAQQALTMPCAGENARAVHRAERAMWTAASERRWDDCVSHGEEMIRAFGAPFSPPLMIMTRCVAARGTTPEPELTYRLGVALLEEMTAHPQPSADQREQLLLTLRDLRRMRGGEADAARLRAQMIERGLGGSW